jgi:hypothetical protein
MQASTDVASWLSKLVPRGHPGAAGGTLAVPRKEAPGSPLQPASVSSAALAE